MSNPIWRRFPAPSGIHCVEMKDEVQERVARETRNVSEDGLMAYFLEASKRFRREMGRAYPESTSVPMAVREKSDHDLGK